MSKFYKVWNRDRTVRKAVVAKNFAELVDKGKTKLWISKTEAVSVVLEVDGTRVLDDGYFGTLPIGTRFILLRKNEEWKKGDFMFSSGVDQADGPPKALSHQKDADDIFYILRQNIANVVTLDLRELDVVVSQATDDLATALDVPRSQALRIQTQCQRYLDEQQESQEALDLMRLIAEHRRSGSESQGSVPEDSLDGSTSGGAADSGRPKRKCAKRS